MRTIEIALRHNLPIFGVCLGLQAMAEYFGSRLWPAGLPDAWKAFSDQSSSRKDSLPACRKVFPQGDTILCT